ncbi:MAG: hypothetical protein JWQ73_2591 [Variovorax sp.]|jgi:hypothetical protein|nr:hypothetical protein [Variovorax sp.]
MVKPLRPPPPPTVLVPDPNARKDAQSDEEQEKTQSADDRVAAGFLKNAIDKPRPQE